jgi:hypothetical protein
MVECHHGQNGLRAALPVVLERECACVLVATQNPIMEDYPVRKARLKRETVACSHAKVRPNDA